MSHDITHRMTPSLVHLARTIMPEKRVFTQIDCLDIIIETTKKSREKINHRIYDPDAEDDTYNYTAIYDLLLSFADFLNETPAYFFPIPFFSDILSKQNTKEQINVIIKFDHDFYEREAKNIGELVKRNKNVKIWIYFSQGLFSVMDFKNDMRPVLKIHSHILKSDADHMRDVFMHHYETGTVEYVMRFDVSNDSSVNDSYFAMPNKTLSCKLLEIATTELAPETEESEEYQQKLILAEMKVMNCDIMLSNIRILKDSAYYVNKFSDYVDFIIEYILKKIKVDSLNEMILRYGRDANTEHYRKRLSELEQLKEHEYITKSEAAEMMYRDILKTHEKELSEFNPNVFYGLPSISIAHPELESRLTSETDIWNTKIRSIFRYNCWEPVNSWLTQKNLQAFVIYNIVDVVIYEKTVYGAPLIELVVTPKPEYAEHFTSSNCRVEISISSEETVATIHETLKYSNDFLVEVIASRIDFDNWNRYVLDNWLGNGISKVRTLKKLSEMLEIRLTDEAERNIRFIETFTFNRETLREALK